MPTALLNGDILEHRVWCSDGVQAAVNVRHYEVSSVVGGAVTDQDVATYMDGQLSPLYGALINNHATYNGVQLTKIFPNPPAVPVSSTVGSGVGVGGADALPLQVAGLLSLKTGFSGRAYRGRLYIPFPSQSGCNTQGGQGIGYQTAAVNLALAYTAAPTITVGASSLKISPVIWHRSTATRTLVTSVGASPRWATQRRRGDYGRPNSSPI